MRDSLNPSAVSRLSAVLRPDWLRTIAARRVAAAGLVVLAAVAALRSDPQGDRIDVVVAARDLPPGVALAADDVRLESRAAPAVPDGSTAEPATVIGATLAGPARRGEALTDVRLLGPRLAESAAGAGARIVPLHLTDTALLDLVRPGDVVDVLGAGPSGPGVTPGAVTARPQVLASGAVVVLVSARPQTPGGDTDRVVLVALPARTANEVASAALVQAITLTFH